jgi:hypothetical protein
MSELIVKFDDKITVGLNDAFVVANVSGYDHYIFVNVDPFDNFTPHILKHFSFPKRTMLVGPRLRVSNVCNKTSLNLDFYTYNFKDIFLNMIVNDAESLWLDFISEEKLESFKQIILTLRPEENPVGMDKLNKTHYIVNMKNNADKITITYLRKEFIDMSIFEKSISEKRVKFVEEIVAVEGEIVEETLEEVVANLEQSLAENVCEYLNDIVAENVEVEKAEERVEEPVIEKVENENVEDEKVEDENVEEEKIEEEKVEDENVEYENVEVENVEVEKVEDENVEVENVEVENVEVEKVEEEKVEEEKVEDENVEVEKVEEEKVEDEKVEDEKVEEEKVEEEKVEDENVEVENVEVENVEEEKVEEEKVEDENVEVEKVEEEKVEDENVEVEKVEEPLEEPLVEKFEVVHSVPCEEPLDACKETVVVVEETIDGFTVASKKMKNSKSKKFRINYSTKNLI